MKTLDEMIAVMKASKTKEIQYRPLSQSDQDWETEAPKWNWGICDYRVKPEVRSPRRFVGLESDRYPVMAAYPDLSRAGVHFADNNPNIKKVEFIELTPEIRERLGL